MASKTAAETYAMLWPDGRLDLPATILEQLGLEGAWQCTVEVAGEALIVRPATSVPEEDGPMSRSI